MSWVHGVSLNRLYVIDAYNFQIVMSLPAMSLGLTFCASRKGGTGEVGGFQHWAQVTWLLLGIAIESPWSALGGPFLSSFARMGLENGLLAMYIGPEFLAVRAL